MKVSEPNQTNIAHAVGAWELNPHRLENGFDCIHQAPVVNGRYAPGCESHSESCCYGCQHHDEIPGIGAKVVERRRGDRLYTHRFPKKTGQKS